MIGKKKLNFFIIQLYKLTIFDEVLAEDPVEYGILGKDYYYCEIKEEDATTGDILEWKLYTNPILSKKDDASFCVVFYERNNQSSNYKSYYYPISLILKYIPDAIFNFMNNKNRIHPAIVSSLLKINNSAIERLVCLNNTQLANICVFIC